MRRGSRDPRVLVLCVATCGTVVACGGGNPSGPTGRPPSLDIDGVAVTARLTSPGTFTYSAFVTLRETGGAPVVVSTVAVALTDASGATSAVDVAVPAAFGAQRIGAYGTLVSSALAVTGALASAAGFVVRVGYRDDGGNARTAERTTPVTLDVTGAWSGVLPIRTPAGDWSLARAALTQSGHGVIGDLVSRDEVRYPVGGSVLPDGVLLHLGGLPGTSTCAEVTLAITRFEFGPGGVQRMHGAALGRCFGTIAGQFELERE